MTKLKGGARRNQATTTVDDWNITRLFDFVEEQLGIGDFAGEPLEYYPWKQTQVGMLKRIMKHRFLTNRDVVMCVNFCKAHRIQPETWQELFWNYDEALKWDRVVQASRLDEEILSAVTVEQQRALSDEEASRWVDMLLRATGREREKVINKWRQTRM